jgi:hypothetical protein
MADADTGGTMTRTEKAANDATAILSIPGEVIGNLLSGVRPDDVTTEEDSPVSWLLAGLLGVVVVVVAATLWRRK